VSPEGAPGRPVATGDTGLRVLQPAGWPRPKGYANGMIGRGQVVFVGGMIGWDAQGCFATDDFAGQARQALRPGRPGDDAELDFGLADLS
jgi:hypothetical protein